MPLEAAALSATARQAADKFCLFRVWCVIVCVPRTQGLSLYMLPCSRYGLIYFAFRSRAKTRELSYALRPCLRPVKLQGRTVDPIYSYTVVLAKLPETTYGITWANSRGRVCACWVLSSSQPDCAETVPLPLTHTPAGTRAHTRTRQGRAKPERQRRQLRAKEPWCSC